MLVLLACGFDSDTIVEPSRGPGARPVLMITATWAAESSPTAPLEPRSPPPGTAASRPGGLFSSAGGLPLSPHG